MTKLEHRTEIGVPLEKVDEYFLEMDNWAASFPGKVQIKKNYEGNPKIGDTFDLFGEVSGQRMQVNMKFVELVPKARHVIERVSGDFKSFKDTVVLEKADVGTRVTETWEYEPSYSILGKILDVVKIRKEMRNYLTEGHKEAKERLEKLTVERLP